MNKLLAVLLTTVVTLTGCSDNGRGGGGGFSEVGAGLTNFSVACRKHDGLQSYKKKGKKVYITCNSGKKFTYVND